MRKLTHQEIVHRQQSYQEMAKVPVVVVADNIRSVHNVGAVFRIADGAGIKKIYLCGICAYPPDQQLSKTALGAEQRVPWEHIKQTADAVLQLKQQGYQIVLLEQMDTSVCYTDFQLSFPLCLVIGNEVEGVSDEVVALADAAVEIPMAGIKNSFNVSVACGIVVFHFQEYFRRNECKK